MRRGFIQRFAAVPHIVWSIIFIIAPLLFMLFYAFTGSDGTFTLENINGEVSEFRRS